MCAFLRACNEISFGHKGQQFFFEMGGVFITAKASNENLRVEWGKMTLPPKVASQAMPKEGLDNATRFFKDMTYHFLWQPGVLKSIRYCVQFDLTFLKGEVVLCTTTTTTTITMSTTIAKTTTNMGVGRGSWAEGR